VKPYNVAICGTTICGKTVGNYNHSYHESIQTAREIQIQEVSWLVENGYEVTGVDTNEKTPSLCADHVITLRYLGETRHVCIWED
jgi:hypothetical protein